jgi:hypothetical protein
MLHESHAKGHPTDRIRTGRELTVVPAEKPPRVQARVAASIMVPAIVGDGGSVAASGTVV